MSLEQSIQNLADAINNLAKTQQYELSQAIVTGFNQVEPPKSTKAEKPAAVAEKKAEPRPETTKAEEKKPEAPKAVEGEVIAAGEKTEAEIREEAFNIPNGYCVKPFLELGKNGNRAAQESLCQQFGVKKISAVALDQIPALKAAIEAKLAEVKGGE